MHLKMMLVDAALKGHVAAIGDCSGAFFQSLLNPDRTENRVWIEPPLEAELGPNYIWEAVSAFPGLKGAPRAWDTYSANVLTSSMQMEQSRYDGCLFNRFEPSREHVEEKAGRHIDDFLVTGPESNVERFLAQAKDKLNMQDAVRWYKTGDERRLLAMNLRKLENGYSFQYKLFSHSQNCHSTRNGKFQNMSHTRIHLREITGRRRSATYTKRSAYLQNMCWQSNVPQSSSSRHSAQREYTFQSNEKSDDDSNAKAQEAYPLLAWHK